MIVPAFDSPVGLQAKSRVRGRLLVQNSPRARAKALRIHRAGPLYLGRAVPPGCPTGHALLNTRLPSGGWPRRRLTELFLRHHGMGEMDLLAPCLQAIQHAGGLVMLFDPPPCLSHGRLVQLGLDQSLLLRVETACLDDTVSEHAAESRLWAVEQALRSGQVGAIVAWLPSLISREALHRLQRAVPFHDGPAFMLLDSVLLMPTGHPGLRLVLRESKSPGQGVVVQLSSARRPAGPARRCASVPGVPGIPGNRPRPKPKPVLNSAAVLPWRACIEIPLMAGEATCLDGSGEAGAGRPAATFVNLA